MEEEKKKTFFKLGITELIIVLLVGIIVFGTLIFFKVVDISSFIGGVKVPKTIEEQIQASSEVKGVKLEVTDYEGLRTLLSSWNVFNKNFQDNFGGTTKGVGVSSVHIILTDKEMPEHKYTNGKIGGAYVSSQTKATPGKLTIKVFVHPQILKDSSQSIEWNNFFQTGFISGMYNFTHPLQKSGDGAKRRGALKTLFTQLHENKQSFFKITKQ